MITPLKCVMFPMASIWICSSQTEIHRSEALPFKPGDFTHYHFIKKNVLSLEQAMQGCRMPKVVNDNIPKFTMPQLTRSLRKDHCPLRPQHGFNQFLLIRCGYDAFLGDQTCKSCLRLAEPKSLLATGT